MKRIALLVLVALFLLLFAVAVGAYKMNRFMDSAVNLPEGEATFEIAPGSSFSTVAGNLVSQGIIEDDFWYRLYARQTGEASGIQAGEYKLEVGATPRSLLEQFTRGSVQLYSFTIIEGWNYRDLLKALHENEAIVESMTDEDWPAFLESLGATVTHPEGLFLPETYRIPRNTTDRQLLTQAYELMQDVLGEEWQGKGEEAPVSTPYEALVLASIVEKETARADERPRIAGVFARRLDERMRLQTDPTVIYGIGASFDGNLTRKHLQTDTPYNTYTRHGLPPTPIAMPGRAAINAVLHPAAGEELYFVATGLGDGSHKFSATKDEHDAAVAEYLKRLRQQRREGR
ncbi:MAG: endolytic transglycosylase MltG [Gammaproteobacteria bacterium]|nr:endolytic transglycosylase MltG [Gammaproteobacteria bacterium]